MDLHVHDITSEAMEEELRVNPVRLEEKKTVNDIVSCTPLMAASYFGNIDSVRILLSAGANFKATNEVSYLNVILSTEL